MPEFHTGTYRLHWCRDITKHDQCVCICVLAPIGLSAALVSGLNASAMSVSWQPPLQLNGPPPLYTVCRLDLPFNYPPQPVEYGTRFMGAGYYQFPPDTIPQGVTFTGRSLSVD